MKSMFAIVTALTVFTLAMDAQANCGNCGPKDASAEKCTSDACDGEKCASNACDGEKCSASTCSAAQCDTGKGCPITAAMARLPKMTYAVGEKKTCCSKEAAKLAKETNGHIHFCVAKKEFDSESDAQTALAEATEKFVVAFTKPHTCPTSGQTTLAGQAQSCGKTAAHTAELMQKAMSQVKFTYLVGKKECSCPMEAGKLAKNSGQEKLFVVGKEKTCCNVTARLNLARAKYKAAVETMVQTQASASNPKETAGT